MTIGYPDFYDNDINYDTCNKGTVVAVVTESLQHTGCFI